MGGLFGGGSKPKAVKAADPIVSNTAPDPEPTATAPETSDENKKRKNVSKNRNGTSALKIDLNIGGVNGGGTTSGGAVSSVNIPS